ncbi:hypothetical protein D3C84_523740 [compost metagenome]
MHRQAAECPLCPKINPRGNPLTVQEWQHVIAIHSLGWRRVDFQPIAKIEQPLGSTALPDQRIKRRQQCTGNHSARHRRIGQAIGRLLPALHLAHLQLAILDQFAQRMPTRRQLQAKIVAQVLFRTDTQGAGCAQQQPPLGFSFPEQGMLQDLCGNDPLRQIIKTLEAPAPRHCHFTGGEQPFQRMLLGTPVPPRASSFLASGQAAGTERPALLNQGQHSTNGHLLLPAEDRQLLINALPLRCPLHAPAHQGIHR